MDKLKPGIKILKFVSVQNQLLTMSMENASLVTHHSNGKQIQTLVNLKSMLAQLQLQSSQPHQRFKPVLQTLFGTATFKNVSAQQIFHSTMEPNVLHATCLNIGIMTWSNVSIVKETNISTQFQEIANHAQLISHCSEITLVKPAHQIHLMMLDQTLVKMLVLTPQ